MSRLDLKKHAEVLELAHRSEPKAFCAISAVRVTGSRRLAKAMRWKRSMSAW